MFRIFLGASAAIKSLFGPPYLADDDDDDAVSCAYTQFVNRTLHIILCIYAFLIHIYAERVVGDNCSYAEMETGRAIGRWWEVVGGK